MDCVIIVLSHYYSNVAVVIIRGVLLLPSHITYSMATNTTHIVCIDNIQDIIYSILNSSHSISDMFDIVVNVFH